MARAPWAPSPSSRSPSTRMAWPDCSAPWLPPPGPSRSSTTCAPHAAGSRASRHSMPLHWTIDSQLSTVDIVAEDDVTVADAMAFFDAIEDAAALPYNKLFNGTRGRAAMTGEELMAGVARIRNQHGLSAMGA